MDAEHTTDFGEDNIEDLFARRLLEDAKEPSDETDEQDNEAPKDKNAEKDASEETPEDESEADESDETEESEEDTEESEDDKAKDKKKPTVIDSDEAVVKIKVDGQEVEAPLKDLKRLYGQEASLTRKSQEAAELRRKSEEDGARYTAGLEGLLERAKKAAEPYAAINFLALTKDPNISQDELSALAQQAQAAFDNVKYLETELTGHIQKVSEQRSVDMRQQAQDCLKVLTDPKTGIQGWDQKLYNDLREFGVNQGLQRELVDNIVDPAIIKVMHKAMMFDRGQKVAQSTKKIDKSPKKIIKGTPDTKIVKKAAASKDDAMRKLARSGSQEDAEDAFLSRLS